MSAAERKRARKAMQEALGEIDEQWTRHLAGPAVGWDKLKDYIDSKAPLLDLARWSINEGPAAMAQTWQWVRGLPGPGAIPRLVREQLERLPGPLGEMMPEAFDAVVGEVKERTGWRMPGDYYYGVPGGSPGLLERVLGAETVGEMMDYIAEDSRALVEALSGSGFVDDLALDLSLMLVIAMGSVALIACGPLALATAVGVGFGLGALSGAAGQLVEDIVSGEWSDLETYLQEGGWNQLRQDLKKNLSSWETYGKQMLLGGVSGAVAGVVGMGGAALGLSPVLTGALSGFSAGAFQQATANWLEGAPTAQGAMEAALIGAAGGAVAGGVTGAVNPQSLGARVALGALVGGGVSGGQPFGLHAVSAGGRNCRFLRRQADGSGDGAASAGTDCRHRRGRREAAGGGCGRADLHPADARGAGMGCGACGWAGRQAVVGSGCAQGRVQG
jgi:hypothetical protein